MSTVNRISTCFQSDMVMLEVPVLSVNVCRIWAYILYQNRVKTAYLKVMQVIAVLQSRPQHSRPGLDWNFENETSDMKICGLYRNFSKNKNTITTSKLKFFQISDNFPTCFGSFLPADAADKNTLNYRSFRNSCCCHERCSMGSSIHDVTP